MFINFLEIKNTTFIASKLNKVLDFNLTVKNEYYVTPVFNIFVENNKKIITMPVKQMWPLGSKDELNDFLLNFKNF